MIKNFLGNLQRRWVLLIVILGVAVWVVGGSLWYSRVYMNKERRFWTAIENGLKTSSIAKEVVSRNQSGERSQLNRLRLGPQALTEGKTSLVQKGVGTSSEVISTNIMTPTESFVRYEKIVTNEKNQAGQDFDFSNVIGHWAKQDTESQTRSQTEAFAESFIQLIPVANLGPESRAAVMKAIKDTGVYEVVFDDATDSEGLTVYDVKLNTRAYVEVLTDVLKRSGLPTLSALDPNQYDPSDRISLKIAIDGANTVRRISFDDENYETYSDYGLLTPFELPKETITAEELQARLQAAQ